MSPNLTIIILSYNVRHLLTDCLESLYQDPASSNWQIIVVDNASTDDSVIHLKKHYPKVTLIKSDTNVGFSAGNNLAVSQIKTPYTLFLNPDTVVPPNTIPFILQYLTENPEVGAATCEVLLPNGKLDDSCHRGFPSPWNSFCHFTKLSKLFPSTQLFAGYNMTYLDLQTTHQIDSLTGAFMMMPTKVGKQLNWWDEDYFWNGEDLDFCMRIHQAGYKVMYIPDVSITHYKGSSGGYKDTSHGKHTVDQSTKIKAAKSSTQAMRIFYRKHYQSQNSAVLNYLVLSGIRLLERIRLSKIN